jgi:hypothetical protein
MDMTGHWNDLIKELHGTYKLVTDIYTTISTLSKSSYDGGEINQNSITLFTVHT